MADDRMYTDKRKRQAEEAASANVPIASDASQPRRRRTDPVKAV
jgi:hypothetical protein